MSEPDKKSHDCSPEPNEASSLEKDAVAFREMFGLDCQSDNKSDDGSMDDSEEESSDEEEESYPDSLSDFDASRPVLGSPQGQCERCKKREASMLCFFCGTGGFCSARCCEMSMERGKHKCVPTEDTTAKNLVRAVGRDLFPEDRQTLEDYYLIPTASSRLGDAQTLLGIYGNLVVAFRISSPQLHQWKEAKQILNNIVRLYNRYPARVPGLYFYWLSRHRHVFLEEDKSEVLDFDAYLRAHDLTLDQFCAALMCSM